MTYQNLLIKIPMLRKYGKIKENGCWVYTGRAVKFNGRVRIKYNDKLVYLSRLVFCITNNLDYNDKSFQANHKRNCDNEICFNPEHMYKGDQFDNMQDKASKVTHCPRGHEYNKNNPKHPKGCRICYKVYIKEYYRRKIKNA